MKAFPLKAVNKFDDCEGMDLRDYFASQAMNQIGWHGDVDSLIACAKECYMIADAMIEAREGKG
jgi:hypothetical protein